MARLATAQAEAEVLANKLDQDHWDLQAVVQGLEHKIEELQHQVARAESDKRDVRQKLTQAVPSSSSFFLGRMTLKKDYARRRGSGLCLLGQGTVAGALGWRHCEEVMVECTAIFGL